jgi:hypothetical protein
MGLIAVAFSGNVRRFARADDRVLEYLLVGFAFGPQGLGVVSTDAVEALAPLLLVGASWCALVQGLGPEATKPRHHVASQRLRAWLRRAANDLGAFAVVATGMGGLTWLTMVDPLPRPERWLLAVGAGSLSAAALPARTQLPALILALLAAALCADAPGHGLAAHSNGLRFGVTVVGGAALGLLTALLIARESRRDETLGLVLGAALLGGGIMVRLGLSVVTTLFVVGLALAASGRGAKRLRNTLSPSLGPVLLPVAVMTGASVHLGHTGPGAVWLLSCLLACALLLWMAGRAGFADRWSPAVGRDAPRATSSLGFALALNAELSVRLSGLSPGRQLLWLGLGAIALQTCLTVATRSRHPEQLSVQPLPPSPEEERQ